MAKESLKAVAGKGKGFIDEFKEFIAKGNVMDLAVGVIIGGAFSKIVTSLTDNILMPIIGVLIDFTSLAIKVNLYGRIVNIRYGMFIQNVVDFLITALCIFVMIKTINKFMKKKEEPKKEEPPAKREEVKLLEEIRDELKKHK